MQTFRKLGLPLSTIALAVSMLAGAPAAQAEPIQITWWHSMGGDLGKQVDKLADEFNASQKQYEVKPTYKGQYDQSMTEAIAAFRTHHQPDILQVYEVGTGTMLAAKSAVVPVYKLMEQVGAKFSADQFIPSIRGYYSDSNGNLLSMPFNTSTPVLYYNEDAFAKAGIKEPPKTWQELEADAQKIKDSGAAKCGYTTAWQSWVNIENYAGWNNLPFASNNDGFDGLDTKLLINTKPFVEHIQRLADMAKKGLFTYGGRADSPRPLFLSGDCAMFTQSSGSLVPMVNAAKFKVGVAMMPYNSDIVKEPQNSILGGATLWVLSGNPENHYKGVAEFLAFLAQPQQQAQWSQATGYVPVTQAAYELNEKEGYYKKYPGAAIAIKELTLHEPTKNSKGIRMGSYVQYRDMINQELEDVWAGKKSAQDALNDAVKRGNEQLANFAAAHK